MAGDWIKMRGNLWDDPRVAKLCDLTDQGEAAIVGALYCGSGLPLTSIPRTASCPA